MADEEQKRKQEQGNTYAMVMAQDETTKTKEVTTSYHPATTEITVTTVQVLCPSCITPKDIDMNMLWRRDNKH